MKRPYLERTANRRRWCEISGNQLFDRVGETVFSLGPNRSGYRGISHRLISRTLGLCLTGVKREPTVKRYSYHYVNVGSATVGLDRMVDS